MTDRRSFIAGLAVACFAAPTFARSAVKRLFDGKSLAGWTPVGNAVWSVTDGILSGDKAPGLLRSNESYRDFELRVELWVSEEANSGVFIRCSDPAVIAPTTAYEVNIFDRRPDPTYGTGAIVDVAKVSSMPKAGGRWNTLLIRAQGNRLSVTFNGRKTVDAVRDDTYREGPIALQYGSGIVKFRKVEIRSL